MQSGRKYSFINFIQLIPALLAIFVATSEGLANSAVSAFGDGTKAQKLMVRYKATHNSFAQSNTDNSVSDCAGFKYFEKPEKFYLPGRTIINLPKVEDTEEQGKVVVKIIVNKCGEVIEANPNGHGTSTSSPRLKAKAKEAALATLFSPNDIYEEQEGTINIIFSFD